MFKASPSKLLEFNNKKLDVRYQNTSISAIDCLFNRIRYYLESIVGNCPTEVKVHWYTNTKNRLGNIDVKNFETFYGRFLYGNFTNKKLHSALQTCFNNLVNSGEKHKQLECDAPDGFYKFTEDGMPQLITEFQHTSPPEAFLVETTVEDKNSEITSPIFQVPFYLQSEGFDREFTRAKTVIKNSNEELAKIVEVPDTLCNGNWDNQVI